MRTVETLLNSKCCLDYHHRKSLKGWIWVVGVVLSLEHPMDVTVREPPLVLIYPLIKDRIEKVSENQEMCLSVRSIDRWMDGVTNRQTDRQTDRHTKRWRVRHISR